MTPIEFERALVAAIGDYNAGRPAQADATAHRLLEFAPTHPALRQLLAVLALDKGDAAAAQSHIGHCLSQAPDHLPSLMLAARAYRLGGALKQARAHAERAVRLAKGAAEPALLAAELQTDSGDLAAALQTLRDLTSHAPGNALAQYRLGLVCQDMGDLAGATDAFRTAMTLRPDFVEAAVNLGVVLQEQRQMDAAMDAYRQAYRLRPETFGRISHALTSAPTGRMWLDLEALKRTLA